MSTQISAGAVQATMRALCGIFVPSATFDSHRWPGHHPVAGEAEDQARRGGLQAEHAGDESSDRDEQEDLRTRIAEAAGEDRGDRVLDLSGDDLLEVRRGQDVAAEGEQGRDRADEDRHEHGLGDAAGRVRDLLGDVAAGLEAVEEEQAGHRCAHEHRQVAAVAGGAHGVEEDGEAVLAFEDEQEQAEPDDADEFGEEADACDAGEPFRPGEVDRQCQHEQGQREDECAVAVEFEPEQAGEEPGPELRHRGDGDDERADVDPRRHPGVSLAPQPPGPGVDPAGDGGTGRRLRRR
jgi:hypothetical protein